MTIWQLYFATLVGMSMHPGYLKPGTHRPSLTELAHMADSMCEIEAESWQSTQQQ